MKNLTFGAGLILLAGCATGTTTVAGGEALVSGERGDLRVMTDGACSKSQRLTPMREAYLSTRQEEKYGEESLLFNIAPEIGAMVFSSFGTFLRKSGEAEVTRSVGSTGGYFYDASGSIGMRVSPQMSCVYLVRNGFGPGVEGYDSSVSDDLKATWTRLGLTRTPDLFAELFLETAQDVEMLNHAAAGYAPGSVRVSESTPYFRANAERLYVHRFHNEQAASDYRDMAVVMNFDSPTLTGGAGDGGPEFRTRHRGNMFAADALRLQGMRKGDYRAESLKALQTGWMPMPQGDLRGTVDLSVYVVESTPGNPLLASIGAYLEGEEVYGQVAGAIASKLED